MHFFHISEISASRHQENRSEKRSSFTGIGSPKRWPFVYI